MSHRLALLSALVVFSDASALWAGAPAEHKALRVLLFASAPTREYQFLRPLLLREADARRTELTICLQPAPGRDEQRPGVVQDVPPERLLSEFPDRLDSYDAIIAIDPDWGRLTPEAQGALKKWVKTRGGGLVLIAGPVNTPGLTRHQAADRLKPILDLYPVEHEDLRIVENDIDTRKPRRLSFPEGGGERSFLKLDEKGAGPFAGWEEFFNRGETGEGKQSDERRRGFFSYTPVRSVKPGAVVLATLIDPKARLKDGKDQPFLVTMKVGEGRVVYLTTGETWRLRQYRPEYHRRLWLGLLAHAAGGASAAPEKPARPEDLSASELRLEVEALHALYNFRFTREQMQSLARLAPQTTKPERMRKPGKSSDDYRQQLLDLRKALIDAIDEDAIDALQEKLDEMTESEKPDVDADVEPTAAARRHAPEVFRKLKPGQLAHYLGTVEDEVLDPREHLLAALESIRGRKADDWQEKRDEIADEVGWLVAGVDPEKSDRVAGQVSALLTLARGLEDEEFKKRRMQLEDEAARIVGEVGAVTVLQHTAEHALAELLSNPRLAAALKARLH